AAAAAEPAEGGGIVLPKRVRQASLAPQLRADAARAASAEAEHDGGRERSADEVRDRMSAIQAGWQRGRRAAEAEPDGATAAGEDASTTAPRTTPEGNGR
ncbi:histidine kinase, partial [Actinacidiphila bryophytorum]